MCIIPWSKLKAIVYIFSFNVDVQKYSKCLGSLKLIKKKTKILYEISKCAINMCVVVLPLGVKFLARKI